MKKGELEITDEGVPNPSSDVWKQFGFLKTKPEQSRVSETILGFAACRFCHKTYAYDSKTTGSKNLSKHLSSCGLVKASSAEKGSMKLEQAFGIEVPERAKDVVRQAAVEFVCTDIRPFAAVEGAGTEKLANSLIGIGAKYGNTKAKDVLSYANTVKNNTFALAEKHKEFVRELLAKHSKEGRMAFTSGVWTDDYRKQSYLDVSVVVMDDEFGLRQYVLSCDAFPKERKMAANIKGALAEVLSRSLKLSDKMTSF